MSSCLKRASSELPALLLDFDGVLCNSTRECFVIAQMARTAIEYGLIPETLPPIVVEDVLDASPSGPFWEFFSAHRAYVRWPREYLLVLEAFGDGTSVDALEQWDFDDWEAHSPTAGDAFQRVFLDCRSFLRERHYTKWVALFDPYQDAIVDAQKLSNRFDTRILTGRDAVSVKEVLRNAGWAVPDDWVFDVREYRNKKEGFKAIRGKLGGNRRYVLVDDNVEHLRALAVWGVSPFWATWGYVTPCHEEIATTMTDLIRLRRSDWSAVLADELERS